MRDVTEVLVLLCPSLHLRTVGCHCSPMLRVLALLAAAPQLQEQLVLVLQEMLLEAVGMQ